MLTLHLLLVTLLSSSSAQSGLSWLSQDPWADEVDGSPPYAAATMWPDEVTGVTGVTEITEVTGAVQSTTRPPSSSGAPASGGAVGQSVVWKVALGVALLLLAAAAALSLAYYLCVWRGGRCYYRPQKADGDAP